MSHQKDQLLTCCSFADKDIEGTYLLINGQVQALCKQHEPVHFTVQGEDKTTVAVQARSSGLPSSRAVYPERNDSSIMTLSILMRWVVTQTNRMIPSMTRYAATTRSRRCPRESEPLACLKFESKQRVIFPLATVAMAY